MTISNIPHNPASDQGENPGEPQCAGRTTLERAYAGYDSEFERMLAGEIIAAIALASLVTDRKVIAIRTGETIGALATCLSTMLMLVPGTDIPSKLREMVDKLAKRIRRDAAKGRAQGIGDIFGAARGGRA
jgi:hypothetical protein